MSYPLLCNKSPQNLVAYDSSRITISHVSLSISWMVLLCNRILAGSIVVYGLNRTETGKKADSRASSCYWIPTSNIPWAVDQGTSGLTGLLAGQLEFLKEIHKSECPERKGRDAISPFKT